MSEQVRYILGIESSCDETACALVTRAGRVAVNLVASQVDLHAMFGGVVPEEAARVHIQACLPMALRALDQGGAGWEAIEAVAVTQGPGLIGCLLVGIETGKALAWLHGKPLIGVNHLAGHLYAIHVAPPTGAHRLFEGGNEHRVLPTAAGEAAGTGAPPDDATMRIDAPAYPHVGLIVSGGHTSLVWVTSADRHETLAQTRDDAVGEAYDKVARVAGLGYPGGPIIDRMALEGDEAAMPFATPMSRRDQRDFSFSGLKTAAGRAAEELKRLHGGSIPEKRLRDLCAGFQRAAINALINKTIDAARERGARDVVIAGGVACNAGLRRRALEESRKWPQLRLWFPHPSVCTDNAAMIAGLAWRLPRPEREAMLALNADSNMRL